MKQNTNIFERILYIAELKGFKNLNELSAFLGYESAEKLYRLKRNPTAKPSYDIIEDFSNKFEDLDVRYFVTGVGEPFPIAQKTTYTPEPENQFSDVEPAYQQLPQTQNGKKQTKKLQATLYPTANFEAKEVYLTPKIITVDHQGSENILYVPLKASAGYLKGVGDVEFMEKLPSFSLPGLHDATYRAFEVDGDSMHPTLDNGEMVIGRWLEKLDYIREDRVHIIVTKSNGVLVKRLLNRIDKYGYVIAKSDAVSDRNLYPNIEIHPDDILEVWYAVWHGGFNFKSPGDLWKRQSNLEADLTDILRRLKEAGI